MNSFTLQTDPKTHVLKDQLLGALIGLTRATDRNITPPDSTWPLIGRSLAMTHPHADVAPEVLADAIRQVQDQKALLVPGCANCAATCGRTSDYDMQELWSSHDGSAPLKALLLTGIQEIAVRLGENRPVQFFLTRAIFQLGEDVDAQMLQPILLEAGKYLHACAAPSPQHS